MRSCPFCGAKWLEQHKDDCYMIIAARITLNGGAVVNKYQTDAWQCRPIEDRLETALREIEKLGAYEYFGTAAKMADIAEKALQD